MKISLQARAIELSASRLTGALVPDIRIATIIGGIIMPSMRGAGQQA